ncbi:spore protease YyaC [Acetivibrio saccincola]|uniref:Germination protease n=1 Tax=Acetivibrio saccincola TaxID=1677857 RepID=A0A2K9EU37_9FIRM|nr:spore protease YyaC [Acetivibrio saccincola]AUG59050.1 germination protease [Acetivibrio saccincola]NLW26576.1 spore protease YyaC [Acetivibrio saccincola]PQQ65871.1 spore protease YyaC [Acetivibrio saccincola]HOA97010.1 spore protease YyaC [Acetivibrio saccincola]HQD28808.1 spore protease YyaC [Acetivibrio saccincola]
MVKVVKKAHFTTNDKMCQFKLNKAILAMTSDIKKRYNRIAVVGIGSDRATGDSFGPLVGHMLSKYRVYDFDVYGTISDPVHAKNIEETIKSIDHSNTLVIAVDASVGSPEHIGHIVLSNQPIKPGNGVGKNLPPVGDISISAVVAVAGFLPLIMLQNTSLGMVYKMAEITANSIRHVLYKQQLEPVRRNKINLHIQT